MTYTLVEPNATQTINNINHNHILVSLVLNGEGRGIK